MKKTESLPLQSARLILRRLSASDAPRLCAYRSLPKVAQYQSWETFESQDATRLINEQTDLEFAVPGSWFQLAIVEIASNEVIGDCGIHFIEDDPRQAELGITLDPAFQNRGYASETLRCVIDHLIGERDMHRVFAVTDAENLAAAQLFERLGFRKEAHFVDHVWFKGAYGSEYLFAVLAREWREAAEPAA